MRQLHRSSGTAGEHRRYIGALSREILRHRELHCTTSSRGSQATRSKSKSSCPSRPHQPESRLHNSDTQTRCRPDSHWRTAIDSDRNGSVLARLRSVLLREIITFACCNHLVRPIKNAAVPAKSQTKCPTTAQQLSVARTLDVVAHCFGLLVSLRRAARKGIQLASSHSSKSSFWTWVG